MSQLFLELQSPQSAGYCLYHSTWIVVKSAEATQVITQPTQIIDDPGSCHVDLAPTAAISCLADRK